MKWIPIALVLLASVALAGLPAPQFNVELKKAEDSAAITSTANAAIVSITSKSGIGGAKLIRTGEEWPNGLTIDLGVKGLESFGMQNGIIHFNTSMKSPKQMPYWKVGKNQERPDKPDGNLEISMTRTNGVIEIVVPKEMTEGNPKEIVFGWIDAFRD
jgi:hypothetical protein